MTVREFMGESVYQMAKPMIERALAGEMVSFENELQTQQGLLMITPRWCLAKRRDFTFSPWTSLN